MAAWNIRPIASALWRNRTGAMLVAFQIAIGLAVLVNAVYVVKQRVEKIGRPTGMDTANMIWIASAGFSKDSDYDASVRDDLAALRGLPGVKAASIFSNIPLSGGGSSSGFQAKPGEVSPKENVPGNTTVTTGVSSVPVPSAGPRARILPETGSMTWNSSVPWIQRTSATTLSGESRRRRSRRSRSCQVVGVTQMRR